MGDSDGHIAGSIDATDRSLTLATARTVKKRSVDFACFEDTRVETHRGVVQSSIDPYRPEQGTQASNQRENESEFALRSETRSRLSDNHPASQVEPTSDSRVLC